MKNYYCASPSTEFAQANTLKIHDKKKVELVRIFLAHFSGCSNHFSEGHCSDLTNGPNLTRLPNPTVVWTNERTRNLSCGIIKG